MKTTVMDCLTAEIVSGDRTEEYWDSSEPSWLPNMAPVILWKCQEKEERHRKEEKRHWFEVRRRTKYRRHRLRVGRRVAMNSLER